MDKNYELIVTIVNKGQSDKVVAASRAGGAKGGTIIYGRGTGKNDFNSVLGIEIQPEREIILTLVSCDEKAKIMKLIYDYADLAKSGNGLCFTLPTTNLIGSNILLKSNIKANKPKPDKKAKQIKK